MNRIGKAYEAKFRTVLKQLHARKLDQGVNWLNRRANYLMWQKGMTPAHALAGLHGKLLNSKRLLETRQQARQRDNLVTPQQSSLPGPAFTDAKDCSARFLCDAGLGGLARWLRASGYEAIWIPDIDDDDLLHEGVRLNATILTTDSMLMERRVLRDGIIPAVWVPPTLRMLEQLTLIFQELNLEMRDSRCMSCGGEVVEVDKEEVSNRVPPRTFKWLNEFFECKQCGKLFWHGTHWRRITGRLKAV